MITVGQILAIVRYHNGQPQCALYQALERLEGETWETIFAHSNAGMWLDWFVARVPEEHCGVNFSAVHKYSQKIMVYSAPLEQSYAWDRRDADSEHTKNMALMLAEYKHDLFRRDNPGAPIPTWRAAEREYEDAVKSAKRAYEDIVDEIDKEKDEARALALGDYRNAAIRVFIDGVITKDVYGNDLNGRPTPENINPNF